MALELIVFDMDDTLYLERDYVRSGFAAVGRELSKERGVEGFATAAWNLFLQGIRRNTFNIVLRALIGPSGEKLVPDCVDIYRNHIPEISLLDDAKNLLSVIGTEFSTALITDGPQESQTAKARALDLYNRLDNVILTSELGPRAGKPAVDSFRKLEMEFDKSGQQCMYVGDNPAKDFIAPLALGWATWRVRRPLSLHENIETEDSRTITTSGLDLGRGPLRDLLGE